MDKNTRVTIDGNTYTPQTFEWSIEQVDYDSGRTADATMHRNKVANKRKVKIVMPPVKGGTTYKSSSATPATLINSVLKVTFSASFPDPLTGGTYSGTFYAGNVEMPVYSFGKNLWNTMSFDIIEV